VVPFPAAKSGSTLPLITLREEMERMGRTSDREAIVLSEAERETFFELGYLRLPAVFSAAEVDEVRAAFERMKHMARSLPATAELNGALFVLDNPALCAPIRIHRVVWCCALEPALLRLGRDARLLGVAAQLLGTSSMDHLISQAHFKLPGDNVTFPWHQDSAHRRYGTDLWTDVNGTGSFVQLLMAVDPMHETNGPLLVLPGSCKRGHIPPLPGTSNVKVNEHEAAQAVTLLLDPGDVLVLGPFTIHASGANRSHAPRRVFINGFSSPGANRRIYPGCGTGVRVSTVST
jgi:ectoine hydroxylase-related dioxygenase (phytanoyl-CoA dioxygenase family)